MLTDEYMFLYLLITRQTSKMHFKKLFFIVIFLLASMLLKIYAQNSLAGSLDTVGINPIIHFYTAERGNNLQLYNGTEYVFLYKNVNGFPFYSIGTFEENSIVYDGALYEQVPLAYDIVSNSIVTKTPDNNYLQLVPEKINSFTINYHFFIQLTAPNVENTALTPGFYNATITDAATVLIKHEKTVVHSSKPDEQDHFDEYNFYYLKIGNTYYAVKNGKSLLNILHDKSNELKTFMHKNGLNFKKNPEQTLIRTVNYYAQLKQ